MAIDLWLPRILQLCAWLCAAIIIAIMTFLLLESLPLIIESGFWSFFQLQAWQPEENRFPLLAMLIGSLLVASGAMLIATPLGIAAAIFGRYYAPTPLAIAYRGLMELLAGIPSVVFGFWGLTILVPWIAHWSPPGASILAGILVLTLMILPLVVLTCDAALLKVPPQYLHGATALGLSRWGTIRHISLPTAFPAIASGIVLQMGRALGETMAVLMVCGNVIQLPDSWFSPVRTLTANIALEMSYAMDNHRAALFASGLLLLLSATALMLLADHYRQKNCVQY
jgi:phosphate transport system permease protein